MNRTFVLTVVVALAACGPEPVDPNALNTTCATSPAAVTGAKLYTDVLSKRCFAGCHGDTMSSAFPYGDYTTVDKAMMQRGAPSLWNKAGASTLKVVDNDTAKSTSDRLANSTMWLKLSAKSTQGFKGPNSEVTGAKMPNDGTTLTDAELQEVKDWICVGAPAM